jgi:DNA-binding transcriptional ArsR family regulator
MMGQSKKDDIKSNRDVLETLFEGWLKPLHSKNARTLYRIMYTYRKTGYITTHDIETKLLENGDKMNKKEINGWLSSLLEADLVTKDNIRGKPTINLYEGKYTYDRWILTQVGINLGTALPNLMTAEGALPIKSIIPSLLDLNEETLEDIEDLFYTAKLLVTLHKSGGKMTYATLRKTLNVSKEKLAIYSWPDSAHSDKPLFEVAVKPPSLKGQVLKLFGQIHEADLDFTLTDKGKAMAERLIQSRKP